MEIRSKKQFFAMWEDGLLGNRPPLFRTLEGALASGLPKIGFREIGKAGGGAWTLAYGRLDVIATYDLWAAYNRQFIMDGSVPNDKGVMQGELCYTTEGLVSFLCVREDLEQRFVSPVTAAALIAPGLPPMRDTMRAGWHQHRGPLETRMLLRRFVDPSSRDDIDMLFDTYPDATIEFTSFSVNTGVIPRRNTIIWEIRNY